MSLILASENQSSQALQVGNLADNFSTEVADKWLTSAIDTDLARANCKILDYSDTADFLWGKDYTPERTNTGRITSKKDWFISEGGMLWQPINPETGQKSDWGIVKPFPVTGIRGTVKGCPMVPTGSKNHPFVFEVPDTIWEKIAAKSGIVRGEYTNFWQWVRENPVPVTLTEGPEKTASLLSAGYAAIGFNGVDSINDCSDPALKGWQKPLHPCLQWILGDVFDRDVIIIFDAETSPSTKKRVDSAINRLTGKLQKYIFANITQKVITANKAIKKQNETIKDPKKKIPLLTSKWEIKISEWNPELGKGIDDVAFNCGQEKVDEIISSSLPYDAWRYFETFTLSGIAKYSDSNRYFGESETFEENGQIKYRSNIKVDGQSLLECPQKLIALKASYGRGKSTIFKGVANENHQQDLSNQSPIISISHRRRLQAESGNNLGVEFINEIGEDEHWKYELLKESGMALVVDSCHPNSAIHLDLFKDEKLFSHNLLMGDEIEQNLTHLAESATLNGKRADVLEQYAELLRRAKKIFLADADLSDISISFIKTICGLGDNDIALCTNNYTREDTYNCTAFSSKTALINAVETALKEGKKIFLLTGAQKPESTYAARNLAQHFEPLVTELGGFIEVRDSESIDGSFDLNEIPKDCTMLIATPVIETGISITKKHFDLVVAIGSGVQSVQSFCQSLERVRYNCDRWIYAPVENKSHTKLGGGLTYFQIKKWIADNISEVKKIYPDWDIYSENPDTNALQEFKIKMAERHNLGCNAYLACILETIKRTGHTVTFDYAMNDSTVSEKLKAIKTKVLEIADKKKLDAEVSETGYENLKKEAKRRSLSTEEKIRLERGRINAAYGYCNQDLLDADRKGLYGKLQILFYLRKLGKIDQKDLIGAAKSYSKKNRLTADFAIKAMAPKIEILRDARLLELLTVKPWPVSGNDLDKWLECPPEPLPETLPEPLPETLPEPLPETLPEPLPETLPEVTQEKYLALLGNLLLVSDKKFHTAFGRKLPGMESPIKRLNSILQTVGYSLTRSHRASTGPREWLYEMSNDFSQVDSEKIFKNWQANEEKIAADLAKNKKVVALLTPAPTPETTPENSLNDCPSQFLNMAQFSISSAETLTQQGLESVTIFPNIYIYRESLSAPDSSPQSDGRGRSDATPIADATPTPTPTPEDIATLYQTLRDAEEMPDVIPAVWEAIKSMGRFWAEKAIDFSETINHAIQSLDPLYYAEIAF